MRTPPPGAQLIGAVILLLFALIGVTNSVHDSAKVVYGITIAFSLTWAARVQRHRRAERALRPRSKDRTREP